jgi:RNA polymerase sigma factor for flagellar operon FliA
MFRAGRKTIRCSTACAGSSRTGFPEAIANLPDRERLVMTLYYYEEMTMREIGLALGVVESRVSQVHASAVVHLRAALKDLAARGAFERRGAQGAETARR